MKRPWIIAVALLFVGCRPHQTERPAIPEIGMEETPALARVIPRPRIEKFDTGSVSLSLISDLSAKSAASLTTRLDPAAFPRQMTLTGQLQHPR